MRRRTSNRVKSLEQLVNQSLSSKSSKVSSNLPETPARPCATMGKAATRPALQTRKWNSSQPTRISRCACSSGGKRLSFGHLVLSMRTQSRLWLDSSIQAVGNDDVNRYKLTTQPFVNTVDCLFFILLLLLRFPARVLLISPHVL